MSRITKSKLKHRPKREYLRSDTGKKSSVTTWLLRLIMFFMLLLVGMFLIAISSQLHAGDFSEDNRVDTRIDSRAEPGMDPVIDSGVDHRVDSRVGLSEVKLQDVSEGSLLLKTQQQGIYQQVPIQSTEVDMRVSGMIVRAQIRQTFVNPGSSWVEGIYVFPLPEQAAVDHLRMKIGDRIIQGKIKEKQQAKKIYEQAKQQGKKAALIEQQRPNIFTNSVANIGPGEKVVIEIEYQQVLHYDQGQFALRFPMAITPRFIPGKPISEHSRITSNGWAENTDEVPDASQITPPVYSGEGKINPVSLRIELDVGIPLQSVTSTYHTIRQRKHGIGQVTITLDNTVVPADRDFELRWIPEARHAPRAAVFSEQTGNDYYHLLMVLPPDSKKGRNQSLAREVIYVIDTSGSMSGISIEQAKRSLQMALNRLKPADRFNVIQFNSVTDVLFSTARHANFANVKRARHYVQRLQANGGTNIGSALDAALGKQNDDELVRQVIFLTDGSVGNESALFDKIKQQLGQSRLFTVGIGSAPNSYFMRKAAQFGRGSFTYISDVSEVKEKMSALFGKLESPVMSDLNIMFNNNEMAELWPKRVPDLYKGEPVIVAARTKHPLINLEITGQRANAPWKNRIEFNQDQNGNGIGVFWARNKISALMDSLHDGADKQTVRKEVINVALKHHLVSRYTSLVAVDVTPTRPQEESLLKHNLPVNLPHGQSVQKIFGRLPQTATSSELNLLTGIVLLLIAWLSLRYRLMNHLVISGEKACVKCNL